MRFENAIVEDVRARDGAQKVRFGKRRSIDYVWIAARSSDARGVGDVGEIVWHDKAWRFQRSEYRDRPASTITGQLTRNELK